MFDFATDRYLLERLAEKGSLTGEETQFLMAEILVRHWLYRYDEDQSQISQSIRRSAEEYLQERPKGAKFVEWYQELIRLRHEDDGSALPQYQGEAGEEHLSRVAGKIHERVKAFLEADGLLALIPKVGCQPEDGIAVPFRFVPRTGPLCFAKGREREELTVWADRIDALCDLGPAPGGVAVEIRAALPHGPQPDDASLGLAVALAWERRQARKLTFYSPLDVLATGEVTGRQVASVRGTGGAYQGDESHGAKGNLAKRLGVKLFVTADALHADWVLTVPSGTDWPATCEAIATRLQGPDSLRYLQSIGKAVKEINHKEKRFENENALELWSFLRRMGRLEMYYRANGISEGPKLQQVRKAVAAGAGLKDVFPGKTFDAIESRHPGAIDSSRNNATAELNALFSQPEGGILLVKGRSGAGKSALITAWRRQCERAGGASIFYHYFSSGRDRLREADFFWQRLFGHIHFETDTGFVGSLQPDDTWEIWNERWRSGLLIFVDGLDEASASTLPFSGEFPKHVWVIVTCRTGGPDDELHPHAQEWKTYAEKANAKFEQFYLEPLNQKGLCAWLNEFAARMDAISAGAFDPAAVDPKSLLERTGDNAHYIDCILKEVEVAIRNKNPWKEIIEDEAIARQSFQEYLAHQWTSFHQVCEKKRGQDSSYDTGLELLTYLLVAGDWLSNRELTELMNRPGKTFIKILPAEARRWMSVQTDDEWGDQFIISEPELFTALDQQERASLRQVSEKLDVYCEEHWRLGSPYALRHLPRRLIERRDFDQLIKLVRIENPSFRYLQRAILREPFLLLSTIRHALEEGGSSSSPPAHAATIATLALLQSELVHQFSTILQRPDSFGNANFKAKDKLSFPIQWDPAAEVMWHLIAAWCDSRKISNKRTPPSIRDKAVAGLQLHLEAIRHTKARIPASWSFLASRFLTYSIAPDDPLLYELATKLLPSPALEDCIERVAKKGERGQMMAEKLAEKFIGRANIYFRSAAWSEIAKSRLFPLGEGSRFTYHVDHWTNVIEYVLGTVDDPNVPEDEDLDGWKVLCAQVETLGRSIWKIGINGSVPAQSLEMLYNRFDYAASKRTPDPLEIDYMGFQIETLLGRIAAWIAGIYAVIVDREDEAKVWFAKVQAYIDRHNAEPVQPYVTRIQISLEMAQVAADIHQLLLKYADKKADSWRRKCLEHLRKAEATWKEAGAAGGTPRLEMAQLKLKIIEFEIKNEVAKLKGIGSGEPVRRRCLRELDSVFRDHPLRFRMGKRFRGEITPFVEELEPLEWDQVACVALKILAGHVAPSPSALATKIARIGSSRLRQQAISHCVKHFNDTEMERFVRKLKRDDVAAAWSAHACNQLDSSQNWEMTEPYLLRAIVAGSERAHGCESLNRAELLAVAAVRLPLQMPDLLAQISEILQEKIRPEYEIFLRLNICKILHVVPEALPWIENHLTRVDLLLASMPEGIDNLRLEAEVMECRHLLKWLDVSLDKYLPIMMEKAFNFRYLTHRIEGACELAERAAACRKLEFAHETYEKVGEALNLWAESSAESKKKMLGPHLSRELYSSYAKGICHIPFSKYNARIWARTVRQARKPKLEPESEPKPKASVLDPKGGYEDISEWPRACVIAQAWGALFDPAHREPGKALKLAEKELSRIADPSVKTRALRDLTVLEIQSSLLPDRPERVSRRIEELARSVDKDDVLFRLSRALANNTVINPDRRGENLKLLMQVIPAGTEFYNATYLILADLVTFFPAQAGPILHAEERHFQAFRA